MPVHYDPKVDGDDPVAWRTYMEGLRNKLEYTEQMLKLEQRFRQEDKERLDREVEHWKASDKLLLDLLKEQGVPQDRCDARH